MRVQRDFEPEIAKRLETISIKDLETLLGVAKKTEHQEKQPSKWAKIAKRIQNDSIRKDPQFQKAWSKMRVNMREFRENFAMKHDQ